ncbi:DUF5955 family protein [Streptomyces sp. NPDC002537]
MEEEREGSVGQDPRVDALRDAVSRLRRALAAHPARLPDRDAAEDELAELAAMARAGEPEVPRLRRSLLLVAGAVGSVSALSPVLAELRAAVDGFGEVRVPEQAQGPGGPPDAGLRQGSAPEKAAALEKPEKETAPEGDAAPEDGERRVPGPREASGGR